MNLKNLEHQELKIYVFSTNLQIGIKLVLPRLLSLSYSDYFTNAFLRQNHEDKKIIYTLRINRTK